MHNYCTPHIIRRKLWEFLDPSVQLRVYCYLKCVVYDKLLKPRQSFWVTLYMRRTAGYTWTDYKTNTQITKELKITPILDKLLEYKRNCIQNVNRMPRNRLPRVMKHHFPTGKRNYGRPLKRLLDTWDRNGSTSGPTPWQIYDDDDEEEEEEEEEEDDDVRLSNLTESSTWNEVMFLPRRQTARGLKFTLVHAPKPQMGNRS